MKRKTAETMSNTVINVIDDDPAVSQAISIVAKSQGYLVAAYRTAEDFLYGHDPDRPGCILLDVKMPGMSGLELQKMLGDAGVRLPVIIMSGHSDVPMAVEAMSLGAVTFLEKPFRMNVLKEQIERAVKLDEERRASWIAVKTATEAMSRLTEKEREVLESIMQEKTNKEIAEELGVTLRAVEDRRSRLMKKLEVESIIGLVDLVRTFRSADN